MSKESDLFDKLWSFTDRYDIVLQMSPREYTIHIERDGVPLFDYGSYHAAEVMEKALQYLKDVRKMRKKNK